MSTRSQDHQSQLDALGAAHCREIIVETATTRGERPKLTATLERMHSGDALVIYKPDRIARSMKELLVLLEDQLHARGINLDILTGICAAFFAADAMVPKDAALPRPAARTVARYLADRREFPVVDVMEALEALSQPELLRTETTAAEIILSGGPSDIVHTAAVLAPEPLVA